MKKLISATMVAGGLLLAGGQFAAAYPSDDAAAPIPPATPQTPTPGTTLPATGGDPSMLLQIGLISGVAGVILVGAGSLRRRRLTDS